MPNGNDLIETARSQLNVKEQPLNSNSGPMVNTYLKSAGSTPGSPWCMAFIYWCSCQAGIPGLPKTASVDKFYQASLALGKIIAISDIAVGDIVLRVDYPVQSKGQKPGDHAGIYTGKNKVGIPLYISGNTVSTNPVVTDDTSSYVDEHQMKHFNYAARFW
ncbi:TPA: hypothetical protein OUJ28_003778 [Klebsiella quasipneumoniae]|nr:hypothetical protein [Klebsiella quasipneumoniae]